MATQERQLWWLTLALFGVLFAVPAAGGNCFSAACGPGEDLAACTAGSWTCGDLQFCRFEAHSNGEVSMQCENQQQLLNCVEWMSHNPATCEDLPRFPPPSHCRYCCLTERCVRDLVAAATPVPGVVTTLTSAASAPDSVTTVRVAVRGATHAAHVTHGTPAPHIAGPQGCLTTPCQHHTDLALCMTGTWACQPGQFCKIDAHANGDVNMHCQHIEQELDHCLADHHAHCSSLTTLPHQDCVACCTDEACLRQLVDLNHTAIAATPPPRSCFTAPCDHHTDLAHCMTGNWTCGPDQYCKVELHHNGDVKMHCLDNLHQFLDCWHHQDQQDPLVCNDLTSLPPLHDCVYCCQDEACVRNVTATTYGASVTTPGASVTTPGASVTTPAGPQASVITDAPQDSVTSPAALQNTQAAIMTNSALTASTTLTTSVTVAPAGRCVQCGDYDRRIPCDDAALFKDPELPCPNPSATPYCQTDVIVDSQANIAIYKRCVNEHVCQTEWYDQTSDKPVCLNFDPAGPSPDLACHFCCVGDVCNKLIIPPYDSQWRP